MSKAPAGASKGVERTGERESKKDSMTTISQPPVVLPIPVLGDDYREDGMLVPCHQPIISFKDSVVNSRHEQWKAWVEREQRRKAARQFASRGSSWFYSPTP